MFEKKFLKDKDLEFLEECSNEDLKYWLIYWYMTRTIIRDIRKHYPEYACIKSHTLTNYRKHGQRLHMNFNSMAGIVLPTSFGDTECRIVKS